MPEMMPVQSSAISAVGYYEASREPHVRFQSGDTTHAYAGVSPEAHAALLAADSIGKHFHQHIRGRHDSRKIGI